MGDELKRRRTPRAQGRWLAVGLDNIVQVNQVVLRAAGIEIKVLRFPLREC